MSVSYNFYGKNDPGSLVKHIHVNDVAANLDENVSIGVLLRSFAVGLSKSKLLLSLWFMICIISAIIYLSIAPAIYIAQSAIVLEPKSSVQSTSDRSFTTSELSLDTARADSQMQIIKSERLLHWVFDELRLDQISEFTSPESFLSRLQGIFWSKKSDDNAAPEALTPRFREAAFQNFSNRLGVRRVGQSYVIEITFFAQSASLAAHLANAVAMAYINQQIEAKFAAAQSTTEYLAARLKAFNTQLEISRSSAKAGKIPDTWFPDADSRVIGAARAPTTISSPQKSIVLISAVAFFLVTGGVLVAVRQSRNDKIFFKDDVSRLLGIRYLGSISVARLVKGRSSYSIQSNSDIDLGFAEVVSNIVEATPKPASGPRSRRIGLLAWSETKEQSLVSDLVAHYLAAQDIPTVLVKAELAEDGLSGPNVKGVVDWASDQGQMGCTFSFSDARQNKIQRYLKARFAKLRRAPGGGLENQSTGMVLDGVDIERPDFEVIDFIKVEGIYLTSCVKNILSDVAIVVVPGKTSRKDCARLIGMVRNANVNILGFLLVT